MLIVTAAPVVDERIPYQELFAWAKPNEDFFKTMRQRALDQMEAIEAVKAVSELYCPVTGEVVESNAALDEDPALINTDPYGEGWMIRLRLADAADADELHDADAYARLTEAG